MESSTTTAKDDWAFCTLIQDRDYLLRCALSHGWEEIISFCDYLIRKANSGSLENHDWLVAAQRQLQACDHYGNSVLQSSCYYQPSIKVIEILMKAMDMVGSSDVLYLVANDQSTALQVACATGADTEVIRSLLASTLRCTSANTNIHPGSLVTQADQIGSTPLSELVVQYTLQLKSHMHIYTSRPLEEISDISKECKRSSLFNTFWKKVELLLQAIWNSYHPAASGPYNVLHAAASIAGTCPALLTDLLIRCFFDQVRCCVSTHGPWNGWLPIHLTLLTAKMKGHRVLRSQQCYFFDSLLRIYPHSTGALWPHLEYRSLLIHAIVWGADWYDFEKNFGTRTGRIHGGIVVNRYDGILHRIYKNAPHTLRQRDAATGLYPFQLAALRSPHRQDDERQLDTIYNLLREYPLAIMDQY